MLYTFRDNTGWMSILFLDGWTAYRPEQQFSIHLETGHAQRYSVSDDLHQVGFRRAW